MKKLSVILLLGFSTNSWAVDVGGLIQVWALDDTTAHPALSDFRVRRAEISANGEIPTESQLKSRYFFQIDPAKSLNTGPVSASNDNKILQDAGLGFSLSPEIELIAGQFKTPTAAEGLDYSGDLLFPERSLVARTYGYQREAGGMVVYHAQAYKLSAMISNSGIANEDDTTNSKNLHIRADVPVNERLSAGAFTTAGDFSYGSKARWGVNARWNYGAWRVQSEGVHAEDFGVSGNGVVVDVAYLVTEKLQGAVRFDELTSKSTTAQSETLGLSYFLAGHRSEIQASYSVLSNEAGALGTPSFAQGAGGSLLVLAFQVEF